jgi:uncharacterized protein with FMN-binding domain
VRRIAVTVAVTVVGLWVVLSFKSSPLPRGAALSVTPGASATTSTAPPDTTGQPPAGPPPPNSGSAPAGPASTTTTTPPSGGQRTVNGSVVSNRYGDVQVAVVLNGKQIVDVKALQMPFDRARSAAISDQAAPLLHDEVLQAQSANIDIISGATYTSDSYAQSLQAALDAAGH